MKKLLLLMVLTTFAFSGLLAQTYDMSANVNMKTYVPAGQETNMKAILENHGTEAITSFDIHYSISNQSVVTEKVNNVSIKPGEKYYYSFKTPWNPEMAGKLHDIKVWTSSLNGQQDENNLNDIGELKVLVNNGLSGSKEVFVEFVASVNDGDCPDGYYKMDELVKNAGIHGAIYHISSIMFTFEGNDIVSRFNFNSNEGMVDRTVFTGQSEVNLDRDQLSAKAAERLNEIVPIDIDITDVIYDEITQFMTIETDVKFVDDAYGLIRVSALITEKGVFNKNDYDYQHNNYNNVSGHPFFGAGDSFNHIPYNMVVRKYFTDKWGRDIDPFRPNGGHFPKDSVASFSFESFIDKYTWKLNDLDVYVLVTYYDPVDNSKMEIINVRKYDFVSSVKEENTKSDLLSIYPNPVNDLANVEFYLDKSSEVKLTIFNSMGQIVDESGLRHYAKGVHHYYFATSSYKPGIYVAVLEIEGQKYTKTFIK